MGDKNGIKHNIIYAAATNNGTLRYYSDFEIDPDKTVATGRSEDGRTVELSVRCDETVDDKGAPLFCEVDGKNYTIGIPEDLGADSDVLYKFAPSKKIIDVTDEKKFNEIEKSLEKKNQDDELIIVARYRKAVYGISETVVRFKSEPGASLLDQYKKWEKEVGNNIATMTRLFIGQKDKKGVNFNLSFASLDEAKAFVNGAETFILMGMVNGEDIPLRFKSLNELRAFLENKAGKAGDNFIFIHQQNTAAGQLPPVVLTGNNLNTLKTYCQWVSYTKIESFTETHIDRVMDGGSWAKYRISLQPLRFGFERFENQHRYQEANVEQNQPTQFQNDATGNLDENYATDDKIGPFSTMGLGISGMVYPGQSWFGLGPELMYASNGDFHILQILLKGQLDIFSIFLDNPRADLGLGAAIGYSKIWGDMVGNQRYSKLHKNNADSAFWKVYGVVNVDLLKFGDDDAKRLELGAEGGYGDAFPNDGFWDESSHGLNIGGYQGAYATLNLSIKGNHGVERDVPREERVDNPYPGPKLKDGNHDPNSTNWLTRKVPTLQTLQGSPDPQGLTDMTPPRLAVIDRSSDETFMPGSAYLKVAEGATVNDSVKDLADLFQYRIERAQKYGITEATISGKIDAYADPDENHYLFNLSLSQDRADGHMAEDGTIPAKLPEKCLDAAKVEKACTYTESDRDEKKPAIGEPIPGFKANLKRELEGREIKDFDWGKINWNDIKALGHGEVNLRAYNCGPNKDCTEVLGKILAGEMEYEDIVVEGEGNIDDYVLNGINIADLEPDITGKIDGKNGFKAKQVSLFVLENNSHYGWENKNTLDKYNMARGEDLAYFMTGGKYYLVRIGELKARNNAAEPPEARPVIKGGTTLTVYECGTSKDDHKKVLELLAKGETVPTTELSVPVGTEIHLCKKSGSSSYKGELKDYKVSGLGIFVKEYKPVRVKDANYNEKTKFLQLEVTKDGQTTYYLVDLPESRRIHAEINLEFEELKTDTFDEGDMDSLATASAGEYSDVPVAMHHMKLGENLAQEGLPAISDFDKKALASAFAIYGQRRSGKELVVFVNLNSRYNKEQVEKIAGWVGLIGQQYAKVPVRVVTAVSDKYNESSVVIMECERRHRLYDETDKEKNNPIAEGIIRNKVEAMARDVFVATLDGKLHATEAEGGIKGYIFETPKFADTGLDTNTLYSIGAAVTQADTESAESSEIVMLVFTNNDGLNTKALEEQLALAVAAHSGKRLRIRYCKDKQVKRDAIAVLTGANTDKLFLGDTFASDSAEAKYLMRFLR